jgi:hypothetical protein
VQILIIEIVFRWVILRVFIFENGFDKKMFCVAQRKDLDCTMGGNAAWRKRVAKGELAKGAGGAALRHRPRMGRRGEDLKLNRKGNIAGGNPKKMNKRKDNGSSVGDEVQSPRWCDFMEWSKWVQLSAMILTLYAVIGTSAKWIYGRKNQADEYTNL